MELSTVRRFCPWGVWGGPWSPRGPRDLEGGPNCEGECLCCSGISWKAYWGIVWNTSFTWSPVGINLFSSLPTVGSEASVRGSIGKSAKSDASFFCLGSGLVCFLNSVASCPNSGAFRRVGISSSRSSCMASAAIMASRSVDIVRCSSGPASCKVLRPA